MSDLTSPFYQILLAKSSMLSLQKFSYLFEVFESTPDRQWTCPDQSSPEELMCRILGDCLKMTVHESSILSERSMSAVAKYHLLGWIWTQGHLPESPNGIATLFSCSPPPPETVRFLRPFIGACKVLNCVLPKLAQIIAPLEISIAGLQSRLDVRNFETV